MPSLTFLRTVPGRILRVAVGAVLLGAGMLERSTAGVLLMMMGLIPIVTGIANICLVEDVVASIVALSERGGHAVRHKQ